MKDSTKREPRRNLVQSIAQRSLIAHVALPADDTGAVIIEPGKPRRSLRRRLASSESQHAPGPLLRQPLDNQQTQSLEPARNNISPIASDHAEPTGSFVRRISRRQQNPSRLLTRRHIPESFRGLIEGKPLPRQGTYNTRFNIDQHASNHIKNFRRSLRQRRAQMHARVAHVRPHRHRSGVGQNGLLPKLDEAPPHGKSSQACGYFFSSQRVEHDIDPLKARRLKHSPLERSRTRVEDSLDPQPSQIRSLGLSARRRKDNRT